MRLHHLMGDMALAFVLSNMSLSPSWCCELEDGTDVLLTWLTNRTDGWHRSHASEQAEATTHRISVDVPAHDVTPWDELKRLPGFPWALPRVLEDTAQRQGLGDPATWFVIGRPIKEPEWIEIVRVTDDAIIWRPPVERKDTS
jgi:hypothetical protein